MTRFARHFATDLLLPQLDAFPILSALFAAWQLPGPDAAPTAHGLRLAVRAGYLNFYAKGQSVAKLSVVRGTPRLDVHRKYAGEEAGPDYVAYSGDQLAAIAPAALDGWVRQALGHAGEEKRFVDDLVSANPGTIDLEMGLPGDERVTKDGTPEGKKVAPRMDLVVLQDGGATLAFWEAKCADNGELRAQAPRQPHVVGQLGKYVAWLSLRANKGLPDRGAEVLAAYREAATVLATLAERTGRQGDAALALWRRAQAGVDAVRQPGVVIGNYWPPRDGEDGRARTALLAAKAESFARNGHRDVLIQHHISVKEYAAAPTAPLPPLAGERLAR